MRTKYEDRKVRRMRGDDEQYDEAACAGKVGYRTEDQAQRALDRVNSHCGEWASAKFPCRVYFCDTGSSPCFRFHLTSQEGRP